MIDQDLINLLSCPETKKNLELADAATIEKINAKIEKGQVLNRLKQKITEKIDGGLFREGDHSCIYPIRNNIPILLVEELIGLQGI